MRFGVEVCGWMVEGGVEEPYRELRVDEDFVVLTVPVDPAWALLVPFDDFSVLLAPFLRRKFSKKGMTTRRYN